MKIIEINTTYLGSTGKIMLDVSDIARKHNHKVYTFSRKWKNVTKPNENHFFIGSYIENIFHRILSPMLGAEGMFSMIGTFDLVRKLKKIKPDIIHLHNLHGSYINLYILFKYIKKNKIRVIWTLHDCWAFTGHCPHFTIVKCDKWKTGCMNCPQPLIYPKMYIDTSKIMYKIKKKLFCNVDDLTIITPSTWLKELVADSYLKKYNTVVINNGINLEKFRPVDSDFRKKYKIKDGQIILLGVSFAWGVRKGLDVFIELFNRLDKERFKIVLVGTNEDVDKSLPSGIISIHRTNSQEELAEIYSASDLFINPTREDNYPTVNIEALACGTPVFTFRTGGSPEMLDDTCGCIIEYNDIDSLEKEIINFSKNNIFLEEKCLDKAKNFNMYDKFEEYVKLYEKD